MSTRFDSTKVVVLDELSMSWTRNRKHNEVWPRHWRDNEVSRSRAQGPEAQGVAVDTPVREYGRASGKASEADGSTASGVTSKEEEEAEAAASGVGAPGMRPMSVAAAWWSPGH